MRIFNPAKMKKVAPKPRPEPAGRALLRKMANEIVDAVAVVLEKLQAGIEKTQEKLRGQVTKVGEQVKETQATVAEVAEVAGRIEGGLEQQLELVRAIRDTAPEPRPRQWKFEVTRKGEGRYDITAKAIS
jgi:hypothetical protein